MDKEIKKPFFLYRILIHTILLLILAQFIGATITPREASVIDLSSHEIRNGQPFNFDFWFFEFSDWSGVALINAVFSWPSWLIAYLFSLIFRKSYYPRRLVCLSFALLIIAFLEQILNLSHFL